MSGQPAAFWLSNVDAAEKLRVSSALSERSAKSCAFNRPPNAMATSKKGEPALIPTPYHVESAFWCNDVP